MSESILRLKVSSEEYDNKLKRATEGLTRYIDGCRKVGGTLEQVEKETLDYVRSLGQMETTSRTATGRLNEMKKTFVDLSVQYNSLTDAEKSAPFGRGIAESLDQLKPRILNAKQELEDINKSLGDIKMPDVKGGGLFSGLGDKMSGALQVFAGNIMTKAAGAVANLGSEMYGLVQQGVELARQGEGIRNAFERLGRGDILDGLRQATHGTVTDLELMKAAVKFNDFKLPLDELGVLLQFAQQKAKDTGQSVDYLVESIVNGLGRKSLMILDNLGLSATEVKERMAETGDMTKAVGDIIREQMAKAGDYVETAADRAAKADVELKNAMEELGRTFQPLTDASDSLWNSIKVGALNALNTAVKPLIQGLAEVGALGAGARSTAGFNNLGGNSKVDRMIGRLGDGKSAGAYSIYKQQLAEFDKYINNKQFQIAASGHDNSSVAQSAKVRLQTELDGALKMRAEYVKRAQELHNQVPSPFEPATTSGGATGGGGKGGSRGGKGFDIASIAFNPMSDSSMKFDPSQHAQASGLRPENILGPSDEWEKYKDTIAGSIGSIGESMSNLTEWTPNFDPFLKKQKEMTKAAKQQQMAFNMGAEAAANLGAAFASMEDPAARAAGTVISAIANIALGFGMAVAQASSMGPWAWLAYVAAGTAALATTISTVHSLTGYAEGGMIKGNSYSGDNIGGLVDGSQFVGLNAGEIVLNKSQQSALAGQLQGNGINGINLSGRIKGTDIILSVDRSLQLQGKQLLTWG